MLSRIVIVGATSAIAAAVARRCARDGASFLLVARDERRLREVADDLLTRGAGAVHTMVLDVLAFDRHPEVLERALADLRDPDTFLIAHGELPDQAGVQRMPDAVRHAFRINATSVLTLATLFASWLERRGSGNLTVIGSLAGDRGRASDYVFGAAKGAVDRYLEGLRGRLASTGVRVVTIKPGPVHTPRTDGRARSTWAASPARVARAIHRAMRRRNGTVYVPWFWRPLTAVLRWMPEPLFRRLAP